MPYGQILTEEQWAMVERAEGPMYAGQYGVHPFTAVRGREDSQVLRLLWEDAEDLVRNTYCWGPDPWQEHQVLEETALRVAAAFKVLSDGTDTTPLKSL